MNFEKSLRTNTRENSLRNFKQKYKEDLDKILFLDENYDLLDEDILDIYKKSPEVDESDYLKEVIGLYFKSLFLLKEVKKIKNNIKIEDALQNSSETLFISILRNNKTRDKFFDSISLDKDFKYLHGVIRDFNYLLNSESSKLTNDIRKKLKILYENPESSFFYSEYLKLICSSPDYVEEKNQRIVPFEVAKGVYMDTYGSEISKPGVFDELKSRLGGKDELLDSDDWEEINKYFRPITSADVGIKDETINNNEDLEDFKFFQQKGFRSIIENSLRISLKDLTLSEQFYFLEYSKKTKNKDIKNIFSFCKKYNTEGLRTFLSIEYGGKEMGDKILTLGEKLPENIAKKVFKKYSEIIDNVNKISEFIRNNFKKEIKINPELIKKIEKTLYIKGKQLLEKIYENINRGEKVDFEEVERQLDRINADTITTFTIFKQAIKNGEKLPIESIEGSVFSKKNASEISADQQEEMINLYETNWKNHPDKKFVESLKSYFKTAFIPESNQSRNHFYTFEKDKRIRAFVRFEEQKNGNFYASALNVDEASKNFGLGEAMMDEALTREAREHILYASCRKDNPSNMRYFEKGFVSKGFKKTDNTEELDLVWDEQKNKDIISKQKTQEELVTEYLKGISNKNIEIKNSKTLEELHTEIPINKALVRCFQYPEKIGSWYAVYEVLPESYGVNSGEAK